MSLNEKDFTALRALGEGACGAMAKQFASSAGDALRGSHGSGGALAALWAAAFLCRAAALIRA